MAGTNWPRVGRRIRKLREQQSLSQSALAGNRLTGAAISQIENGHRHPSADTLRYIASKLGTTESYLLEGRAPDLEIRLRLETEQHRLACHQGKAQDVVNDLDQLISEARRYDLVAEEASAREVRALALRRAGRHEEAMEEYDRVAEVLASAPAEARVGAVTGRARCLYLMNDAGYAAHVLESYRVELRRRPVVDPTAMAHVQTALIGPYFKSGLVEKAREAAEDAGRLLPRVSQPDVVGCSYLNLAGVYLGEQRVDEAIRALGKAEDCFKQLEWTEEIATTYLAQAMAFVEKEEWPEARKRLQRSLAILEEAADSSMRAAVLNQLGKVERQSGKVVKAEKYLTEALGLLADGDLNERGLAQRELGLCARERADFGEARKLLLSAVDSYRLSANAQQLGATYIELGDLERDHGDADESSRFYREGLEAATAPQAGA